jgi:hypothetical protein
MKPTTEQLSIINSRLPGTKMTADMVEVLPFRVFDNAVTDRFTIMSTEMMAKVAKDLNDGRAAFNKLHQSRESLPVGRSVNAKMMTMPETMRKEVHANMYAVIKNPDGTIAEDGAELANKYNTGAVYACSAGVSVGFYKCNICGNDIRDWQNCEHSLGKMYKVDEQPKQCMALMTGRDIQDGMAMDCGIYEVSAVTAGGVANAGVLTETFGHYSEGTDIGEFKKTAFANNKDVPARINFEAYGVDSAPESNFERTPTKMALEEKDVQKMLDAQFGTVIADKAKLEVEYKHLEEKHTAACADHDAAKAKHKAAKAEFATEKEAFVAKEAEFAAEKETIIAEFATKEAALIAEKDAYEVEKAALEAFKAEYVNSVFEAGNKIGKTDAVDVYAAKTLEELKTLSAEFALELNKLFPSGRQSSDAVVEEEESYGIPASVFKTDK